MRYRFALSAAVPAAVLVGSAGTAHAVPTAGDSSADHSQCHGVSAWPAGDADRSAVSESHACTAPPPPVCREEEEVEGAVVRNSRSDTVTISGAPGRPRSSLECATDLSVMAGTVLTFSYDRPQGTDPCAGGVPHVFVVIDGTAYTASDEDTQCSDATGGMVEYSIPVGGTITQVGFLHDRGDDGSVTYRNTMVGGSMLDI